MKQSAAAAGITKRLFRSPSRHGSVDANRKPDADRLSAFAAISSGLKGSGRNVPALFSGQDPPAECPLPSLFSRVSSASLFSKSLQQVSSATSLQLSSQAVISRLACLTVVPVLAIFNVTPPPE